MNSRIATKLLSWWDSGHEDWPWRNTRDPYAIWVAEVMLQQTQVATVLPYYRRWMEKYPRVEDLANSSLDEVLKSWEGLGYYSRARNLHHAATIVVRDHGGMMPERLADLMALKGIGRYTAGAIASIAYNLPVPAVDGNAARILSRLFDISEDITLSSVKTELWRLAEELVPMNRPGEYNQALMELGQQICLPANPICESCPISEQCLAYQRGTTGERPVKPPKKKTPHYKVTAGIICQRDGRFLISKRPVDGLLGGLWEFPGGKLEEDEGFEEALQREIKEELGIGIVVGRRVAVVKHAYTHFSITLHAYFAWHQSGIPQNLGVADHAWVRLPDLDNYALSAADRKIVEHLTRESGTSGDIECE